MPLAVAVPIGNWETSDGASDRHGSASRINNNNNNNNEEEINQRARKERKERAWMGLLLLLLLLPAWRLRVASCCNTSIQTSHGCHAPWDREGIHDEVMTRDSMATWQQRRRPGHCPSP